MAVTCSTGICGFLLKLKAFFYVSGVDPYAFFSFYLFFLSMHKTGQPKSALPNRLSHTAICGSACELKSIPKGWNRINK